MRAAGFSPGNYSRAAWPESSERGVALGDAGSGLPVPSRRTLAAGILPSAALRASSLRHPACARCQGRLDWHGQPQAVHGCADGTRVASMRTNTAAPEVRPAAGGPPRLQRAGMPLQPY